MGFPPKYKGAAPNFSNRRRAVRIRTIRNARIKFGNVNLECVLLDFSSKGARVTVDNAANIPKRMMIVLHDDSAHNAVLRWAKGREIGLEFVEDDAENPRDGEPALPSDLDRILSPEDAGRLATATPEHRASVVKAVEELEAACLKLKRVLQACDA